MQGINFRVYNKVYLPHFGEVVAGEEIWLLRIRIPHANVWSECLFYWQFSIQNGIDGWRSLLVELTQGLFTYNVEHYWARVIAYSNNESGDCEVPNSCRKHREHSPETSDEIWTWNQNENRIEYCPATEPSARLLQLWSSDSVNMYS